MDAPARRKFKKKRVRQEVFDREGKEKLWQNCVFTTKDRGKRKGRTWYLTVRGGWGEKEDKKKKSGGSIPFRAHPQTKCPKKKKVTGGAGVLGGGREKERRKGGKIGARGGWKSPTSVEELQTSPLPTTNVNWYGEDRGGWETPKECTKPLRQTRGGAMKNTKGTAVKAKGVSGSGEVRS